MFGIFDKIEEILWGASTERYSSKRRAMFLDINDKVGAVTTDGRENSYGMEWRCICLYQKH